jgi:hypothetical protein
MKHELIKIYVDTYRKYNNCTGGGAWLTLNDYKTEREFWKACKRLHRDERDPEFFFPDYELPDELGGCITENSIDFDALFEYLTSPVSETEPQPTPDMSKAEIKAGKAAWLDGVAKTKRADSLDYEKKRTLTSLVLTGGELVQVEKPRLKTSFCFGYGQNGISTEEDYQGAEGARESLNQFDAFLEANLKGLKSELAELEEHMLTIWACGCCQKRVVCTSNPYWLGLGLLRWRSEWEAPHEGERELTAEDLDILARGVRAQIADLTARCKAYWKRFGASKLNTWTYLVD